MSVDSLKRCLHCDECIGVRAARCPKCQSWQTRNGLPERTRWVWPLFGLFIVVWLALNIIQMISLVPRYGTDFDKYLDQIELLGARIQFGDDTGERRVVTVGTLKNHSPRKWRDVTIEVHYFDRDGKLIGANSGRDTNLVLVPGGEHAFQLIGPRVLPTESYSGQKVFVRDAIEARGR